MEIRPDPNFPSEVKRVEVPQETGTYVMATSAQSDEDKRVAILEGELLRLKLQLATAGTEAKKDDERAWIFLVLLFGVGAGAVTVGVIANNLIVWPVAVGIVFMAGAAIVAYAARKLGVFADLMTLLSANADRAVSSSKKLHPHVIPEPSDAWKNQNPAPPGAQWVQPGLPINLYISADKAQLDSYRIELGPPDNPLPPGTEVVFVNSEPNDPPPPKPPPMSKQKPGARPAKPRS